MWLVEATRYLEEAQGVSADEAVAIAQARKVDTSLESKIIQRAQALPSTGALRQERARLLRLTKFAVIFVLALVFIFGVLAASAAFVVKEGRFVNIYWLLSSLLGLHLVSLVLWLGSLAFGAGGLLGHWVSDGIFALARRLKSGHVRVAAVRAMMSRNMRGTTGLWYSSALSHALWGTYLLGALLAVLALLATQRYVFVWETTILSSSAYEAVTAALSLFPAFLGIEMPSADVVRLSEWPLSSQPPMDAHLLWSNFLISTLVIYGVFPRLILVLMSLSLARWRRRALKLDLSRPLYARLIPLVHPVVSKTDIVDEDERPEKVVNVKPAETLDVPEVVAQKIALLGWEIDEPSSGWPPSHFAGEDLGICDDLRGLAQALKQAVGAERLVIALSAAVSPDRGVRAALSKCVEALGRAKIFVLLLDEDTARKQMGDDNGEARLGDWLSAAYQAGIDERHFVVADFDDAKARKLLGDWP